ncbi:MAG: hypothetical protein JWN65_2713 [Solirubrobacterales bacterium]|nr:hypothetical protein [Solirubrobacterales bacterium]
MTPGQIQPATLGCECGGTLRWESRENWRGKRWLAVCSRDTCGWMTLISADADGEQCGLAEFLLGDQEPHPYVKPWVRLFLRASRLGMAWRAFPSACGVCAGSLVMQVDLPFIPFRASDPQSVVLCLDCGQLAIQMRALTEVGEVHLAGEAWDEPALSICALKRTVDERAKLMSRSDDPDDASWRF